MVDAVQSDPLQFKSQLENELKNVENNLEQRTRRLQERLKEVSALQNSVKNISKPSSLSSSLINSDNDDDNNNNFINNEDNNNINNDSNINQQSFNELSSINLSEKSSSSLQDRLELEQSIQRYQLLLDEERQSSTQAKRKAKQLEAELIQIKKRLQQEMTTNSQKDQKLNDLQRKFPTLLSELDKTESRCIQLTKDKEELQQELQTLRREFQQFKDDSLSTRKQDQKVKSSLEQNNQKILNEVFTLNTRLTESVLLVSELRSKRERDQELLLREASRQAQLEQTIVTLERENKELKSLLQSHNAVKQGNHNDNSYFQNEISFLRSQIQQLQNMHKQDSFDNSQQQNISLYSPNINEKLLSNNNESNSIESNEERLSRELNEERTKRIELEETLNNKEQESKNTEIDNNSEEHEENEENEEKDEQEEQSETSNVNLDEFLNVNSLDNQHVIESKKIVTTTPLKKRLYKPNKNDSTDVILGKIIRSRLADGLELLPPNFKRIMAGIYQFGTRKIHISLQNNQPVVRVGGGYMIFPSFVKKYGRSECLKTKGQSNNGHAKKDSAIHNALHNQTRKNSRSPY